MLRKIVTVVVGMLAVVGVAVAEDHDAVINDASRGFAKRKPANTLVYGKLKLDSGGKVVSMFYTDGIVTKDTQVVTGTFDEGTKQWEAGDPVKGGLKADLFKKAGSVTQVLVSVGDDKKTITRILVKKGGAALVKADPNFDAVIKGVAAQPDGRVGVAYVRQELDDKGAVVKTFGLTTTAVMKDTQVAMGRYNEATKKWEAGDAIPGGLTGDAFKNAASRPVPVRITRRDDGKGIAQILVKPAK